MAVEPCRPKYSRLFASREPRQIDITRLELTWIIVRSVRMVCWIGAEARLG